jgi:hypothetical protein
MSLQTAHLNAIDELWNNVIIRQNIINGLNRLIKLPLIDAELVFPCDHFSKCYGLNQFLVLLLARYLKERWKQKVLRPQTKLDRVSAHGVHSKGTGKCNEVARDCHGEEHDVWFDTSTCEDGDAGSIYQGEQTYNVVIVRHGIDAPVFLYKNKYPVSNPRQLLPYHVTY